MTSKVRFDDYARSATYRRLGLVLVPIVSLLLVLMAYFAVQVAIGRQQRKVVAALSRTIASNVINGDSFQLKSLVVSAVQSGLFGGIEIRAQGHVISGFGKVVESAGLVPLIVTGSGLDIAQQIPLDGVSDSWVVVSNHFSWLPLLGALAVLAGSFALLIFGSVRVSSQLAHELSAPT